MTSAFLSLNRSCDFFPAHSTAQLKIFLKRLVEYMYIHNFNGFDYSRILHSTVIDALWPIHSRKTGCRDGVYAGKVSRNKCQQQCQADSTCKGISFRHDHMFYGCYRCETERLYTGSSFDYYQKIGITKVY